jgi:hypothetical protein
MAPFTEGATPETRAHDPLLGREQPPVRTARQNARRAGPGHLPRSHVGNHDPAAAHRPPPGPADQNAGRPRDRASDRFAHRRDTRERLVGQTAAGDNTPSGSRPAASSNPAALSIALALFIKDLPVRLFGRAEVPPAARHHIRSRPQPTMTQACGQDRAAPGKLLRPDGTLLLWHRAVLNPLYGHIFR